MLFVSGVSGRRGAAMDTIGGGIMGGGVNTVDFSWTLSADVVLWDNVEGRPLLLDGVRGGVEIGSGFSRGTVDADTWTAAIEALTDRLVRDVRLAERD